MSALRIRLDLRIFAPYTHFYTSAPVVIIAFLLSSLLGALTVALGMRMVVIAFAALIPWLPILLRKFVLDWRTLGWMAVFEFLVALQLAHFAEHAAQVIELHWLMWPPALAQGIVTELDAEGVHWWWNTAVLAITTVLLLVYRRNGWLWASLFFSLWHEFEHFYLYFFWFLPKAVSGHPGILGAGGLLDEVNINLGILTELGRADLHFWYNFFEVGLFLVAFVVQASAWAREHPAAIPAAWPRPMLRRVGIAAVGLAEFLVFIAAGFHLHSPVDLRVPGDYASLQAAVNAAPPWAIIHVGPGSFDGPVVISKPVSLIGAGNGQTQLAAADDAPVIHIQNTHDVVLKGLAIRGGLYGILVDDSTAVLISNDHVLEASFVGIRLSRSSAEISNDEVRGTRGPFGMGIELANTVSRSPSVIRRNVIADNAHEGFVMHNSQAMVEKNTVTGNGLRGIAVTEMSMATVRGNTLADNADAGIFVVDSSMAEIFGNDIRGVRPGPTGSADGIRAYYYAEVMLGDNTIAVEAPHAVVSGYEAEIAKR